MKEAVLRHVIHSLVQPTPEAWTDFTACVDDVSFPKGEALITAGLRQPKLYLITSGIVRHYLTNVEEEEITTWFTETGGLATDFASFTTGVPCLFGVQAMTDIEAYAMDAASLRALYDKDKIWERMGRIINQHYLLQLIHRNNAMHKKTARMRYEEFCKTQGHLFQTIPLKCIATYLGITLETLSRLRGNKY